MPIRKIVTEKKVAESINRLPEAKSPVLDEFYPSSKRRVHPSAFITITEIQSVTKAVPVVMRGTMPVSIGDGAGQTNKIEPQPVDVIMSVTGAQLNDIKQYDDAGEKAWLDSKTEYARNTIRVTTEALAIQSLSGTINFPMKTEDGFDTYKVEFGSVLSYVPTVKLSSTTADVSTVIDILNGMVEKLQDAGSEGSIVFKASPDVFSKLTKLLRGEGDDTAVKVKIGLGKITIDDDIVIERYSGKYYNPQTKAWVSGIAEKTIKAVVKDNFAFRYLALDNVAANLKPLPLFINPIKRELPSGWVLNALSKPFPIPDPNGICDAVVL